MNRALVCVDGSAGESRLAIHLRETTSTVPKHTGGLLAGHEVGGVPQPHLVVAPLTPLGDGSCAWGGRRARPGRTRP